MITNKLILLKIFVYTTVPTLSGTNQNVAVLSTQSISLECLPSNPNFTVQWILHRTDGSRIPLLFGIDISNEFKRNIQLLPDIEANFPYHQITITNAIVFLHSGVYECRIETPRGDNTVISRNITLNVLPG